MAHLIKLPGKGDFASMGDGGKAASSQRAAPYPAMSDAPTGLTRLELNIPVMRCGLIIGKGAQVLKELQQGFDVRLTIPRNGDPEGTSTIIEGAQENVENCYRKVVDLVRGEAQVVSVNHGLPGDFGKGPGNNQGKDWYKGKGKGDKGGKGAAMLAMGGGMGDMGGIVAGPSNPMQAMEVMWSGMMNSMMGCDGGGGPPWEQPKLHKEWISDVPGQQRVLGSYVHPMIGPLKMSRETGESAVEIWNLPGQLDEYGLYLLFAPFGAVVYCNVQRSEAGIHTGRALVRYTAAGAAQRAANAMNGTELPCGWSPLEVSVAKPKAAEEESWNGGWNVYEKGGKGKGGGDGVQMRLRPDVLNPGAKLVKVELAIPGNRCGLLIGSGGKVFKELQSTFGVSLVVPRQGDRDGSPTVLEGEEEAVKACCVQIEKMVRGDVTLLGQTETAPRKPMGQDDIDASVGLSEGRRGVMQIGIPSSKFSALVGPRGKTCMDLEHKFQVKIDVPKRDDPEGTPTQVQGPEFAVQACFEQISTIVQGEATVVSASFDSFDS